MRLLCSLILLLCITGASDAQQGGQTPPAVKVRSNLVMVPVFVNTKRGQAVLGLKRNDFVLTDNGIPQIVTLEEDTDSQPLALAIVVETGGAGATHLEDYRELDSTLDALVGNVERRVAVIAFDGKPHLIAPFSSKAEDAANALANLTAGDQGAAILDAVTFAVGRLRELPSGVPAGHCAT